MDFSFFDRHQKIALQFSGGKDSLAILHLLKPYWDRVTVYWTNPGNPFPETTDLMSRVRAMVPHFKEVRGLQPEIIALDGWPSDVVPVPHTSDGHYTLGEKPFRIQGRLNCCIRSLMIPMHQAMLDDGVTCIVRGRREDEADKSPARPGAIIDGIEFVFPLWDWSAEDVLAYLESVGEPIPAFYKHGKASFDCMDCTAWWGEGLSHYLRAEHPIQFKEYERRIGLIKQAIADQLGQCEV